MRSISVVHILDVHNGLFQALCGVMNPANAISMRILDRVHDEASVCPICSAAVLAEKVTTAESPVRAVQR